MRRCAKAAVSSGKLEHTAKTVLKGFRDKRHQLQWFSLRNSKFYSKPMIGFTLRLFKNEITFQPLRKADEAFHYSIADELIAG